MQDTDQHVQRIYQKVQQLVKQQKALQKLNQELTEQLADLKKQKTNYRESIDDLQQQIAVLKAAKSQLTDEEKKAFEKRLGQYIREIDRCITMLSE